MGFGAAFGGGTVRGDFPFTQPPVEVGLLWRPLFKLFIRQDLHPLGGRNSTALRLIPRPRLPDIRLAGTALLCQLGRLPLPCLLILALLLLCQMFKVVDVFLQRHDGLLTENLAGSLCTELRHVTGFKHGRHAHIQGRHV